MFIGSKSKLVFAASLSVILFGTVDAELNQDYNFKNIDSKISTVQEFYSAFLQFASATHVDGDVSGQFNSPTADVITNLSTLTGTVTLTANTGVDPGEIRVELRDFENANVVVFSSTTSSVPLGIGDEFTPEDFFTITSITENEYDLVMTFGHDSTFIDLSSLSYTVDQTPPDAPTGLDLVATSDTGSSDTDNK